MQGTQFLKPGKTPDLGADQPLYAIAKQLQCSFPDSVGKDELVVRMEALHIEDKVHETIGVLLRDSWWTYILTLAEIVTSGHAQSAVVEHHLKHTRYAHQVSVISLHLLRQKEYKQYYIDASHILESFVRRFRVQETRTHCLSSGPSSLILSC